MKSSLRKNKSVIVFLLIIIILITSIVIGGVSFAYWSLNFKQETTNEIATNCFDMDIKDKNAINLQKAISILNSEGEKLTPYTLTIKNICDNEVDYQINLETLDIANKLEDTYITLKVNNNENKVLSTYSSTDGIIEDNISAYKLYNGHLKKDQVMSFEIRMWVGEEVKATEDTMSKDFQSKVTVEATVNNKDEIYKEDILNGADPVLKYNLIPVTIDDKGNVYKADTKSAWYNYADKKWANAVILEDGISVPEAGAKIDESQIESYFVWIPKYSYQLWDLGNYNSLTKVDTTKPHTIPIRFGTYNTTDEKDGECETPMNDDKTQGLSGDNKNCQVGEYMTHPAFISFGVNGLWVGKFETGYRGADSITASRQNISDISKVIIKPNVYSWRYINVGNAFKTSYEYQREILDSHMMKNTEWGAVAYLSHSIYGINQEIMNNNNLGITGYASKSFPTIGQDANNVEGNKFEETKLGEDGDYTINYLNSGSQIASTTGNYTGIYDMAGGIWEYVMGYIPLQEGDGESGLLSLYSDFNTNQDWNKYYDKYSLTQITDFDKGILGDATGEMGPFAQASDNTANVTSWYNDFAMGVAPSRPWYQRGGHWYSGNNTGIFAYWSKIGKTYPYMGFRIVLAPKQG